MNPTGQSTETDASLLIRFGHRKQYGLTVGLMMVMDVGDDHRATFRGNRAVQHCLLPVCIIMTNSHVVAFLCRTHYTLTERKMEML